MLNYDTKSGALTNVIEFHMDFFDILFPLNIGPLTYRSPEALSGSVKPGMIVSAALKNKISKGIVIGKSPQLPAGPVKDIQSVHGETPVLSEKMIGLLKWMADYYLAEQGLVLKNILPKEAFVKVKQRKRKADLSKEPALSLIDTDNGITAKIIDSINSVVYEAFLLFSPSSAYEYSLLVKTVSGIRNGIILVPEVSMIGSLYPALRELLGERVSLFHSELSGGERSESIQRIISGRSDIVLGTRSAIFAPLEKVSFIAVLHEHSTSYKQENSPCYSARDVAVMRGYIEKSTVLLSSICPSVESLFNCKTGKYHLLTPTSKIKRPRIKVVDMNREKLVRPYLSKAVIDGASRHIKDGKTVAFILNRRGYSTLLQCVDCGRIEECPHCKIPLVFHKQDMSLKCHYCGYALPQVPELCSGCKGHNLKLSGAGTQKVQEDIEELTGTKTVRIDSDRAKRKTDLEKMMGPTFIHDQRIIVGTKLMTGRLGASSGLSMAVVLNIDLFLNIPDFRSAEKAYQEIVAVVGKIELGGEVFVQTRMPQNYLFRYLKDYDYDSFFKEELGRRKALAYPPYARLLLLKFVSERDIAPKLSELIHEITPSPIKNYKGGRSSEKHAKVLKDVEILGPFTARNRQGKEEVNLLLKSPIRANLHETAMTLIEALKEFKDVRIKVDVDPIVI
jgi:primosomal protein N' (replication factor Y)